MNADRLILRGQGKDINVADKIKYCALQTNVWNATMIDGVVELSIYNGKLTTIININDIELKQRTIFAYPEIAFGNNLMNEAFNKNVTKIIDFPLDINSAIESKIKLRTDFRIESFRPTTLPFNISYDFWIREDINSHDYPAQTDTEIMIWVYRNQQNPIGKYSGDIEVTCLMNGKEQNIRFSKWVGRGNRWLTVSYIIDTNKQQKEGQDIEIPLSKFLAESQSQMDENSSKKYILGIEMGSEFGNPQEKKMELSWELARYEIKFQDKWYNMLDR